MPVLRQGNRIKRESISANPTPAGRGGEIRPASAVNVFGRVVGDATVLKEVVAGAQVKIAKAE
ncbi:MAG: cyclophilin-like family protein [Bacillota bacterium]